MNPILPRAASILLFAALCASLAYWVITLSHLRTSSAADAPAPLLAIAEPTSSAAAQLFPGASRRSARTDIHLMGILDLGNHHGAAAILTYGDGPERTLTVGQELGANLKLAEVRPHSVVVDHDGVKSEVFMPSVTSGPTVYLHGPLTH